jgi:hypothetical protein
MKRLHTLKLSETSESEHYKINTDFILSVAGEVPRLRYFGFRADGYQNQFIDEFGQKYPGKELLVSNLT